MSVRKPQKKLKRRQYSQSLDEAVQKQGFDSYEKYLESPHWASFKQECKEEGLADCCIACGYLTVIMHHVSYRRLGHEEVWDVIPLCNRCHTDVHRKGKSLGIPIHNSHLILQHVWRWTDKEVSSIFQYYLPRWEKDKRQLIKEARAKSLAEQKKKVDDKIEAKTARKAVNTTKKEKTKQNKLKHKKPELPPVVPVVRMYEKTQPKLDPAISKLSHNFEALRSLYQSQTPNNKIAQKFGVDESVVVAFVAKYKKYFN